MQGSVLSLLPIRLKQVFYFILSLIYRFDHWHYRIVRENCRYFDMVSKLHRQVGSHTTIEIGCGIGEIISGLKSPDRIGIDRDQAVIKAAKFLRSPSVRFFTDKELPQIVPLLGDRGSVCLVFLNWFHVCEADEVNKIVGNYVETFTPSHIIFDVINQEATGYRYKHIPGMLNHLSAVVDAVDAGDGIRKLVLVEVHR